MISFVSIIGALGFDVASVRSSLGRWGYRHRGLGWASPHDAVSHGYAPRTLRSPEDGFLHDSRFATLREIVDHYDGVFLLDLTQQGKNDLVELLELV